MKKLLKGFSKREVMLWISSVMMIAISFFVFSQDNIINLFASIIGVSAVFINAKGNPVGQVLMIIFSLLYGIISCRCAYYGEMITYLFMTAPMAAVALVSWVNNPYSDGGVEVNTVSPLEVIFMFALGGIVTFAFYFILKYFETSNLIVSTFSILTSFIGAYLSFRRSAFFRLPIYLMTLF